MSDVYFVRRNNPDKIARDETRVTEDGASISPSIFIIFSKLYLVYFNKQTKNVVYRITESIWPTQQNIEWSKETVMLSNAMYPNVFYDADTNIVHVVYLVEVNGKYDIYYVRSHDRFESVIAPIGRVVTNGESGQKVIENIDTKQQPCIYVIENGDIYITYFSNNVVYTVKSSDNGSNWVQV